MEGASVVLTSQVASEWWMQGVKTKCMFLLNTSVNANVQFTHPEAAAVFWLEKEKSEYMYRDR